MADPALDRTQELADLRAMLRKKFPGIGVLDRPEYGVLPSGIPTLDGLLPGGLPRGAITLLEGGPSSGKTGVALAFCAELTRQGGHVAWVHEGALTAPSAAHAGVALNRLLVVRADSTAQAQRCADFLLRWQAFHLVVLDRPGWSGGRGASWNRLARLVSGSTDALLVLAPSLPDGDPARYCASVQLSVSRVSRGLGCCVSELTLLKSRYGGQGSSVELEWPGMEGSPFELGPDAPGLGQEWHDEIG